MKKVIFYSYSKCSTCRKASKWLDQNNINYEIIDIIEEPPSKEFLELALIQFSLDIKKIFNTRGKNFKSININFHDLPKFFLNIESQKNIYCQVVDYRGDKNV